MKSFNRWAGFVSVATLAFSASLTSLPAVGAEVMEEIVVTAQRAEESLQEVPIAVTALTGEMLEDKGIVNPSDLQMSAPNVSFTATNFGGSSFSIRGIGRLVIGGTGESGVSTHINEIPLSTNLNAIEFFDVKRVEVLRGPQGTLFGRNATGGSVNMVTNMPTYDALDGFVDVEAGDYNNMRVKGAINIPLGDTAGLRIAGFKLDRDGYIENKADDAVSNVTGQPLPGIDDDIDGRDIFAARVSLSWDFSDNGDVWVQYNYFDEDDDRARLTNQVCQQTALPALGCEPNGFGFDSPHMGSTTGGLFFGLNGLGTLPLGASGQDGVNGVNFDFPQPDLDIREMFTDFEPIFQFEEEIWSMGAEYQFQDYTVSFLGAYQETEYLAQMDYNMNVGPLLNPSPAFLGLGGLWPTSAPAGGAGADVEGGPCNYYDGTAGIFGGCTIPGAGQRLFAMDSATSESEYWSAEVRLASSLDGPFNFQVGVSAYKSEAFGDYYVNSNSLDSIGLVGVGLLGFPRLYPTMFNVPGNPSDPTVQEGEAIFAEFYYNVNERLKLTFGLRRNKDEKAPVSANAFLSSVAQNDVLNFSVLPAVEAALSLPPGSLDADTAAAFGVIDPNYAANIASLPGGEWSRLSGFMAGGASEQELAIMAFQGVSQADIDAASLTLPYSAERAAISNQVGAITGFNETRALTGSPTENEWTATTGRVGFDYLWRDDIMIYGFFSRGYKPGGFNPPIAPEFQNDTSFTFDEEEVDAIEVGFKSTLLDGTLILNGSLFDYDYQGLQVTRIKNNSSINENIDADIRGFELEYVWRPLAFENVAVDGSFSWLDTELGSVTSVDVTNKSGGDPNWINLKNIDPGANTGVNYIAFLPDITPALIAAAYASGGALSDVNGATVPGTVYPNGVPAYFSENFLSANGVATSAGLPVDISGNQLPNAPEFTFRFGAQYTWPVSAIAGDLTLRWDYYWQDDMFAREFNTAGDAIDSWDQHNMSLIYESTDGNWQARAFIRNLQDEDNVTGHYLTSDTSGFFRNYFLTEPRIYGLSVRYSFGGQ